MEKLKTLILYSLLFSLAFFSCNRGTSSQDQKEYQNTIVAAVDMNVKLEDKTLTVYDTENLEIILNTPNYELVEGWHIVHDFAVLVEYDVQRPHLGRFDDNVISNVILKHYFERGGIKNILDIDNTKIIDVLVRPILNIDVSLRSATEGIRGFHFSDIAELIKTFGIVLPEEDVINLNDVDTYEFVINRIIVEALRLYFYRPFFLSSSQFLNVIEYEKNSNFFDWNIKIGTSKDDIIERFGNPSANSADGTVYIFESFTTLRKINITFENDRVRKVQLIAASDP